MTPVQRYEEIAAALSDDPAVTRPDRHGFGRGGLILHGKLLAVLRGDELLLKLPAPRVAQLIQSGLGAPFDANKGKPMKEWVLANMRADWPGLVQEASEFVGKG